MTEMKADRLQVRVDLPSKRLLEEAASAAHLSMSAFVLQAACQRAEELLADRSMINLSPESAEAFIEALTQPAQVSDRLHDAVQRPVKVAWLD